MIQYFGSQGGSDASLNYSVVGGTQQPAGKENRIWVNTDQPITGHIFSATAPSNPTEGLVWFATGSESTVPFSATQKNSIMVYPQTCQQFINGDWVTKVAKSYISGDWHDWTVILFSIGNAHEEITGGYEGRPVNIGGSAVQTTPTFDINTGITQRLVAETTQNSGAIVTKNKINLTDFSQIQFDITLISTTQEYNPYGGAYVYVTQTKDNFNDNNKVDVTQANYLDISSLTGDWYVAIGLKAQSVGGTQYGAVRAQVTSITMS